MKIKICPKCGSKNIGTNAAGGSLVGRISDFCKDCGFNDYTKGPVFLGEFPYLTTKKQKGKK